MPPVHSDQSLGVIMADECRCVDCGFLFLVDIKNGGEVIADDAYRDTGKMPQNSNGSLRTEELPRCHKGVDLVSESKSKRRLDGFDVACRERSCNHFMKLEPGRTPSRHIEMIDYRAFQALVETRHQELRADTNRQFWIGIMCSLIAALVSFLAATSVG